MQSSSVVSKIYEFAELIPVTQLETLRPLQLAHRWTRYTDSSVGNAISPGCRGSNVKPWNDRRLRGYKSRTERQGSARQLRTSSITKGVRTGWRPATDAKSFRLKADMGQAGGSGGGGRRASRCTVLCNGSSRRKRQLERSPKARELHFENIRNPE